MNFHIKQIAYIILMSIFFSIIRYFFIEGEYPLIKPVSKAKVENYTSDTSIDSLKEYLNNITEPKIINLDLAQKIHQFDIATFIDARDSESYQEKHIKGALNITFEMLEEFAYLMDIDYMIEEEGGFWGYLKLEQDDEERWLKIGLSEQQSYISSVASNPSEVKIENKNTIFVVYCSGEGCSLSEDLAFYMLERFKIKKILIYEGGMPEWIENNLPTKWKVY